MPRDVLLPPDNKRSLYRTYLGRARVHLFKQGESALCGFWVASDIRGGQYDPYFDVIMCRRCTRIADAS